MDYGKDNYTTTAQVQTYLGRTLTTPEQASLKDIIPAASRWIDRSLGTRFDKLPTDGSGLTARHFKGGNRTLAIDACQGITLVQAINPYDNSVWYTYTAPLEYIAQPYDLPVKNYLEMRRNEFTGADFKFPSDDIGLMVTALFTEYDYTANNGEGAYPSDIVLLANHICAVWLQNSQNADNIQQEMIEGHTVTKRLGDLLETDPMVTRVLESREDIWVD